MNLCSLREQVYEANLGIYRAGLVTMHSGNASGIDETRSFVVIKPSGVDYEKLLPGSRHLREQKSIVRWS